MEIRNGLIEIDENLDEDSEAWFSVSSCGAYINKADAIKIINHLKQVFGIEG